MVEVFKTDVQSEEQAGRILHLLLFTFPGFKINFDLDDCDRILRIEGSSVCNSNIIELVNSLGCCAEALD